MGKIKQLFEKYNLSEKLILLNQGKKEGQVVIAAGGAGCYPKGTEFFTGNGWKNIEEYQKGDKVLQVDPRGLKASLVGPEDYQDLPSDVFYNIKNVAVDFTFSQQHKHLMKNDKTKRLETVSTQEILEKHESNARGCKKYLVNAFQYGGEGIDGTDQMIRLKTAIIADGHLIANRNVFRVRLKKERKIERFKKLLDESGVPLTREVYQEGEYFNFEIKNTFLNEKRFPENWFNMSESQFKVFTDEVLSWDGSVLERENRSVPMKAFFSTDKRSADLVQFAFSSLGKGTNFCEDIREDRTTCYCVYVRQNEFKGISRDKRTEDRKTTEIEEVQSGDRMYCFTVPSGFFVVRQNGKIYVSGNSGKGFALKNFIDSNSYKIIDVDELKKALIELGQLKGDKELSGLNLKNPDDVFKLHKIAKERGLMDKKLDGLFQNMRSDRLPNLIFDKTAKDRKDVQKVIDQVTKLGYKPGNIHIVWVLTDFRVAFKRNITRDRVVPRDVFLATQRGAAKTMSSILNGEVPKDLDGEIHVILNNPEETGHVKLKGKEATALNTKMKPTISDFSSIKVKDSGKKLKKDKETDQLLADWINKNAPKKALREAYDISPIRESIIRLLEKSIFVPKGNLGIPRRNMPQIEDKDLPAFLKWLKKEGLSISKKKMTASKLKPIQKDIRADVVKSLSKDNPPKINKPLLVSKEGYLIDGHHRWLAKLDQDKSVEVDVIMINEPIKGLLNKVREYPKVVYKDANNNIFKDADPKKKAS